MGYVGLLVGTLYRVLGQSIVSGVIFYQENLKGTITNIGYHWHNLLSEEL